MNCEQARTLLHGLLDHELDFVRETGVREHVRDCPVCAAELERQERTRTAIRFGMRRYSAPDDLVRDLRRTVRNETRAKRQQRGLHALAFGGPALAAALGAWLLVPWFIGTLQEPEDSDEKYVYHISSSDNAFAALQNIGFHLEARPNAQFVVVTHNEGVDFLLEGAEDPRGTAYRTGVANLAGEGVEFRVCNNTLNVRNIPKTRVIAEADLVPSGIAEVGRLQEEEGYAYLKP